LSPHFLLAQSSSTTPTSLFSTSGRCHKLILNAQGPQGLSRTNMAQASCG
jgi:hypothetical protein